MDASYDQLVNNYIPFNVNRNTVEHGSAGATPVAGGQFYRSPATGANRLPGSGILLATSAIPAAQLFPVSQWAPNSGLTPAFHRWRSSVSQLIAALDMSEDMVYEGPPPVLSLEELLSQHGRGRASFALAVTERLSAIDRLEAWQRINTALYWHLRPSLLLTGSDIITDTRYIDSLFVLRLADGRSLLLWALRRVSFSERDAQINLLRSLTGNRLKATATRAQLKTHANEMMEVWLLLHTSTPAAPGGLSDIYDFLVASLPSEPANSHLTNVRTWLAGQVAQYSAGINPDFSTYATAIDNMLKYAKVLGLAPGDDRVASAVAIDSSGVVTFSTAGGSSSSSMYALGQIRAAVEKPVDAPGNKCTFCDSWYCTASDKANGGDCKPHCICSSGSSFDVTKCTKGGNHIKARRIYHKDHPTVATLKGLRLRLNEDGTITEIPPGKGGGKGGKGGRGGNGRGRGRGGSFAMLTDAVPHSLAQLVGYEQAQSTSDDSDALSQRDGESFSQWLTRQDNAAPALGMLGIPTEASDAEHRAIALKQHARMQILQAKIICVAADRMC